MHRHVVLDELREVVVVLPVVVREDNGGDASSFGGDHLQKSNAWYIRLVERNLIFHIYLFLDSPNRQHLAPERQLSGHGQIRPDRRSGGQGEYGCHYRHTRTGTILRGGTLGDMQVEAENNKAIYRNSYFRLETS